MSEKLRVSAPLPRRLDVAAIRRSKGISLDAIAESTKISKRFLEAIEQGDLTILPGGIYNSSYVRQYARAIDIDETELLEQFSLLVGKAADEDALGRRPPSKEVRVLGLAIRS